MFTLATYGAVGVASFLFGKYGMNFVETVYQDYKHSRALSTAKAIIAQAEAAAATLAAAKAVVAAAPPAPSTAPVVTAK